MVFLSIPAIALALVALVWLIGGAEPIYALGANKAAWFVALRYRGAASPEELAAGVRVNWASNADFAFIGETYWSRFLVLSGGENDAPLALPDDIDDAYIARISPFAPPKLALGFLRLLVILGILSRPSGEVLRDSEGLGFRAEVMPNRQTIDALLARPNDYAPAMVNFLRYFPSARYGAVKRGTAPVSGRTAYARYGMVALRTVYRTGGHLLFYARVVRVLREPHAGPTLGRWDEVAAMRYPRPQAILSMEQVPQYRAALHHRDAGLDQTVVIASTPV